MKKMPVKVRLPWKHNVPSTMAIIFLGELEKFSNPLSYVLSGSNYLLAVLNVKSFDCFTALFAVQGVKLKQYAQIKCCNFQMFVCLFASSQFTKTTTAFKEG